jgi:hypothetical protein
LALGYRPASSGKFFRIHQIPGALSIEAGSINVPPQEPILLFYIT